MSTSHAITRRPFWNLFAIGCRPKTLTIAASPILAAGGLAFYDLGFINPIILGLTLITALAIQAGTNLYNDAADGISGNDTPARLGPMRLTAMGYATAGEVKRMAILCFALAACIGLYLIYFGGWPVLLVGLLSLASGYAYSNGPYPISHSPLGEVFVIGFFGIIAVTGTYYLQTGTVTTHAISLGLAIGFFGAAVLMVNNHRDRIEDEKSGRRTLAIVSGDSNSKRLLSLFLVLPFILQVASELNATGKTNMLPIIVFPFAAFLIYKIWKSKTGNDLNMLLIQTAKLQFAFSVLYAVGAIGVKLG